MEYGKWFKKKKVEGFEPWIKDEKRHSKKKWYVKFINKMNKG